MNYEDSGLLASSIFNVNNGNFLELASKIAHFQMENNTLYKEFCLLTGQAMSGMAEHLKDIPFLPVQFFKTQSVASFKGNPEKIFSSSGTSAMSQSRHLVYDLGIYEKSFVEGFKHQYSAPAQYAFLCLLPAYLEREGSSLIYMADRLVQLSGQKESGFFLDHKQGLVEILLKRGEEARPTILLGVTYALLNFAEQHPMALKNTIVMETGGMKGRRREMIRSEVHQQLMNAFEVDSIHSEYGMTELLSQAYAVKDGIFECPPWMKVLVRAEDDPREIKEEGTGMLCIADLANLYSCSFIETADLGKVYADGRFEVLGRMDNSDIRGCSLLSL